MSLNRPVNETDLKEAEAINDLVNRFKKISEANLIAITARARRREEEISALNKVTLQNAAKLEQAITSVGVEPGLRLNEIIDNAKYIKEKMDKVDTDFKEDIASVERATLFPLLQDNKSLLELINANPQFADQRNAINTIQTDYEKKKDELLKSTKTFCDEVKNKNDILQESINTYQKASINFAKLKADNHKAVRQVQNNKINDKVEALEILFDTLSERSKELNAAIAVEKNVENLENLIKQKFENNEKLAPVIEQLQSFSSSIINHSTGSIFSLETEKKLQDLKKQTGDAFTKILSDTKIYTEFSTNITNIAKHLDSKFVTKSSHDAAQKIQNIRNRVDIYQGLDKMAAMLKNDNILLPARLEFAKIHYEMTNLKNQTAECYLNLTKALLPDETRPCKKLASLNENVGKCEAFKKQREDLLDKMLTLHEKIGNSTKEADLQRTPEVGTYLNAMKKDLEKATEYIHNDLPRSHEALALSLKNAENKLDDTYSDAELQSFVDKKFDKVDYKLLTHLQDHILNCRSMKDLLKHNRKAGSLKNDLVNTYEAQIKAATNLDELFAAVIDNPKDPNGRMDPNGKILSLRGNTGFSSSFFANSTSNNLMKEIHKELDDQVQNNLRGIHVKRNSM